MWRGKCLHYLPIKAGTLVRATADITAAHLDFSVYRGGRVIKGGTWKTPKPFFFFQDLAVGFEPPSFPLRVAHGSLTLT